MDTFTVHLTDIEGEPINRGSGLRAEEVLSIIGAEPTRYSVQLWRTWDEEELVATFPGQEWLDRYTYMTKPKRVCY